MGEEIICSEECKNFVAVIIPVDENRELLQVGGLLVSRIDGVCIKCGTEFHWSATDRLLKSIISKLSK
jgi:hypothetical protein